MGFFRILLGADVTRLKSPGNGHFSRKEWASLRRLLHFSDTPLDEARAKVMMREAFDSGAWPLALRFNHVPSMAQSSGKRKPKIKGAQLHTTANPDKGLGKERRVHAAARQKGSLCRLKPAFLGVDVKLRPNQRSPLPPDHETCLGNAFPIITPACHVRTF
jgi:hypothetical protein